MDDEAHDDHRPELSGFERQRGLVGLFLGPIVALVLLLLPLGDLTIAQHRLTAVAALIVIFWVTEAIPLPATALLGMALMVVTGIAQAGDVLGAFGDQVIFLFIGSFMIAAAMRVHGLDRRIAYTLLAHPWVGGSTWRTLWALGLTAWLLSMWISNTACVAMLFPVALAIARSTAETIAAAAPGPPDAHRRYATGLLLMVAYAGSIGGLATPVGTPPNLIGIALIEEGTGTRISFLQWMSMGLPLASVLLLVVFGIMLVLFRPPVRQVPGQIARMRTLHASLGPWSAGERNSLLAFVTAVTLWVTPGLVGVALGSDHTLTTTLLRRLPEGIVALLAASLLFLLPTNLRQREFTLRWEDAARIDWGTVILFGGGIALGRMLFQTGLATELGVGLVSSLGVGSAPAMAGLGVLVASIVSETSSNTASANIVLPVMISAAEATAATSIVVGVSTIFGANMGFMLPVSTPPNAIVYGSGQVRLTDMLRAGILLDITGVLLVWFAALWFLPLMIDLW
jgi:sodium-dependent dicarboxylate transporter 2/3/5